MDGAKRNANREPISAPVPPLDPIDLEGSTPPWAVRPFQHPESAIRSTLPVPDQPTINPLALHSDDYAALPNLPHWATQNVALARLANPTPRRRIGGRAPAVPLPTIDADDDDEAVREVDTDAGNDAVYMFNSRADSWSGTLESENDPAVQATLPDQAVLALQRFERAQQPARQPVLPQLSPIWSEEAESPEFEPLTPVLAAQSPRVEAGNDGNGLTLQDQQRGSFHRALATKSSDKDKQQWQKDLLLRNVMRRIKQKLNAGAKLTVECMGAFNLTTSCAHPHCPVLGRLIPPGTYYFILGQLRHLESAEYFCLACLEALWNGEGMSEPLPDREVKAQRKPIEPTILGMNLDGAMDDERLATAGLAPESTAPSTSVSRRTTSFPPIVRTPATDYSSSSVSDPPDMAAEGEHDPSSATPSPRRRRTAERSATTEEAGKLLLDSVTPSPRNLKTTKKASISPREARNLTTGMGERFRDGQSQVAREGGSSTADRSGSGARRSTRLVPPNTTVAPEAPEIDEAKAEPLQVPKASVDTASKTLAAETIADEVIKAERRLGEMYKQRDRALASLEPGQSAVVQYPRGRASAVKHTVSVDMFGVPYTDLLAEPATKYWMKEQPVFESKVSSTKLKNTIRGPMPDKLRAQRHDQSSLPQLDGPSDTPPPRKVVFTPTRSWQSIFDSVLKHDYPPPELAQYPLLLRYPVPPTPPPPSPQGETSTPGGPYSPDSPGSTTSTGEWREPLTRFQPLAAYVDAGNSLNEGEKAAVALWKIASKEQIGWEAHLKRAEALRKGYAASGDEDDGSSTGEPEEGEFDDASSDKTVRPDSKSDETDEGALEAKAGVAKKECRGKDLSDVLAESRFSRNE